MSIEYRDGTFSETLSMNEMMKRFQTEIENHSPIKALHLGSYEEVEAEKEKRTIEKRLEDIEKEIEKLKPIKTFLDIPTKKEILEYSLKGD